jgi:hypothetical protein
MSRDQHKQELHTLIWQIFSMTGGLTETKQLDRLRMLCAKLTTLLAKQARFESIELMRKLQVAVTEGFKKTFAANLKLEKRIKALEEKVNDSVSGRCCQGGDCQNVSEDSEPQSSD